MEIRLTHEELGEPLVFHSAAEVIDWATLEQHFWTTFKPAGSRTAERTVRDAQTALQRLLDTAKSSDGDEQKLVAAVTNTGPNLKLLSTGAKGRLLASILELGYDPKAATMAFATLFSHEDVRNLVRNDHWIFDCMVGIAHVAAFEAGGDPQRLVTLLHNVEEYERQWTEDLKVAKKQTADNRSAHDAALAELRESVEAAQTAVADAAAAYQKDLEATRMKFEEQFALRTPMTYWTEKALRHVAAATRYRRWFTGLLAGGVGVLSVVGYLVLFPFLEGHPSAYWALILFSVAIALLAWPLRMTSKQYLVHQQLYEDATERAVIAQTFLALGETVKLTDADRQLLLGALLRPATISLASDDSGLNVADIILAKTLTKS